MVALFVALNGYVSAMLPLFFNLIYIYPQLDTIMRLLCIIWAVFYIHFPCPPPHSFLLLLCSAHSYPIHSISAISRFYSNAKPLIYRPKQVRWQCFKANAKGVLQNKTSHHNSQSQTHCDAETPS